MILGLDVDRNRVIEVALLVTDPLLNVISPDFSTVIKQNDEALNGMNDWCKENLKVRKLCQQQSMTYFYSLILRI